MRLSEYSDDELAVILPSVPEKKKAMSRDELLAILRNDHNSDPEAAHGAHDEALLAYINDPEVTEAFHAQTKWYA